VSLTKEGHVLYHRSRESSCTTIEQPLCPKCQIRMILVCVELSFTGPDFGTLECPKCELDYKALAEDPMRREGITGNDDRDIRAGVQIRIEGDVQSRIKSANLVRLD
jgi:hypothetical protein